MQKLNPRALVPELKIHLLDGSRFDLKAENAERFALVAFYRGAHSELCGESLRDLARHEQALREQGVSCLAVSCDSERAARESAERWELGSLRVGYGLKIDHARRWGLSISAGYSEKGEPDLFCEPGVFALRLRGDLLASSVNNMPFARPRFEDWVRGFKELDERHDQTRGNF